jgi:hypothetical protein
VGALRMDVHIAQSYFAVKKIFQGGTSVDVFYILP